MVNHLLQFLLDECRTLLDISLLQQDVQCTTEHILHDGCVVATLEDDAHGHALSLGWVRVFLVLHTDVPLSTEEYERVEGLFIGNLVRISGHLGSDRLTRGQPEPNGFRHVLCGELDEDRIGVAIDDFSSELRRFHD